MDLLADMEICDRNDLIIKTSKIICLISVLLNTYMPYRLYGPPALPIFISATSSLIIFMSNYTRDGIVVLILESCTVLAGFCIILGHLFFPNLDEYLKVAYLKMQRYFSRGDNQSVYDNPIGANNH